jgi:hypothetical protein
MACRIGITTNLSRRKSEWESKYPQLRNWKVIDGPVSRTKAQSIEDRRAKEGGCAASGGGSDPDDGKDSWYVYYFEY